MTRTAAQRTADLNATLSRAVRGFRPPESLTVHEWADRYRRLSPEASAEAGPWRTSRTPYLAEPMDAFTDPAVRKVVIVASSQVGKTECELNCLAYLMDQRQNQAMNDLNQSLTGLQDSLTDQSSLQDIYEDNMQLIQQVGQLEEQVKQLEEDKQSLTSQLSDQEKASQAMDWFWQIDEAYVLGRYSLCRELIQEIQDAGLVDYLPKESITDNGRFSPSGRYQEIYEALY